MVAPQVSGGSPVTRRQGYRVLMSLTESESGEERTRHAMINTGPAGKPEGGDPGADYVLLNLG